MPLLLNRFLPLEELQSLLAAGEDVKQHDNGYNALHAATINPNERMRKLEVLVTQGADVNQQDCTTLFHNTPLHNLLGNERYEEAVAFIHLAHSKLNYRLTDSQGKTTLIFAAKLHAIEPALALVQAIGNQPDILNQQDKMGMSALHYACLYGNQRLFDALIAAGASMTLCSLDGKTPLDCTGLPKETLWKTLESVEIDPARDEKARRNNFGFSGQQLVFFNKYHIPEVAEVQSIKQNIPGLTQILTEFKVPDPMKMLELRDKIASIHNPEEKHEVFRQLPSVTEEAKLELLAEAATFTGEPLGLALKQAAISLRETLLLQGHYSGFLLRVASAHGDDTSVQQLLHNKPVEISVDTCSLPSKFTALHQAAQKGHIEVAKLLLQAGSSANCQDKDGDTPLHLAILYKHFELAELLVSSGADLSLRNEVEKNALALLSDQPEQKAKLIKLQREWLAQSSAEVATVYQNQPSI